MSENHTQGVGSLAALKIRSPSLLYFKNVSALSCPLSRIGLCNVTQFVSPCQRSQRELGHLKAAAAQAEGMTRGSMIIENRIVTIVCSG